MTIYKIRSSAVRAAKKEFGDDWAQVAHVFPKDEGFAYDMLPAKEAEKNQAITAEADVLAFLAQEESKKEAKAAKKKEIESRKPVEIPLAPVTSIVAIPMAPTPQPSIPLAPKIPSPARDEFDHESQAALDHHDANETSPDFAALNAAAEKLANAQAVNVDPLRPRISIATRPTKLVWDIADKMPGAKRKEVIEACVAAGIAYGTARTQYQHWFKCINEQKTAPIATIGKDGKITMPGN